jgi:gamma-glutamylcyclotransferase (GGCT)/AIG2-like uncharacterized protein YtfP
MHALQEASATRDEPGRRRDGDPRLIIVPLLFSYGTLQQGSIQLEVFGRQLAGTRDELVGFKLSKAEIENTQFVSASGKAVQANVIYTGESNSRVEGSVFEVTDRDLVLCDEYERPAQYRRVSARLSSGRGAWVYVHNPS